jgi:uncharacterized membrane protein HdeD (DUF308 family)
MQSVEDNYNSPKEKMKRMSIAVKGIGGWFSYFMGMATLIVGTLNIYEIYKFIDLFISFLGISITSGGIYLIIDNFIKKKFIGKLRIIKLLKTFGGLTIIPGTLAIMVLSKDSNKYNTFFTLFLFGVILIIFSMILKKAWGIKTEKRKKIKPDNLDV